MKYQKSKHPELLLIDLDVLHFIARYPTTFKYCFHDFIPVTQYRFYMIVPETDNQKPSLLLEK